MSNIASNPLIAGISEIRKSWAWFLALGLSFMLLGVVCILRDVTATLKVSHSSLEVSGG
jgi:uncharacterized membrane protein HdeD (DUF308 family)